MSDSVNDYILCEVCAADDQIKERGVPTATMHCITCKENQCDSCSKVHRKQKITKDHNIVPIEESTKKKISQKKEPSKSAGGIIFCDSCQADKRNETDEVPTATMHCIKCVKNHCDNCSRAHKNQENPEDHTIVPIENELTSMLKSETYSNIQKIIEKPSIQEGDLHQFWRIAFPYIIQRIKMWNGYVIRAENLVDLVIRKNRQKKYATDAKTLQKTSASKTSGYPVSRLDCLTYLINIADCIVAHDILRIMSKFPMAIPLIIQDINKGDKYIVTVPIIQNTVIKWESTPGQIVENHLFTSPFRMVAAIRLGTNKVGKSTILNQLMSKESMFSSKGEAGGKYGRPCTLEGAVEIVWLTQETCSSLTWKTISEYYSESTEEIAILANLHGSALQHPETLKYLDKHVCSFIVFLMPDSSSEELTQLRNCINSENIVTVFVDPQENVGLDDEDETNTVRTELLASDEIRDMMRFLLIDSFTAGPKETPTGIEKINQSCESLRFAEPLSCLKSEEIVAIARQKTCFNIRQLLSNADIKEHPKWDDTLKRVIKLSLDILNLPTKDAMKHLVHLETNLSHISANESLTARAEVMEASKMLRSIQKVLKETSNSGNTEDKQIEKDSQKYTKCKHALNAALSKFDDVNFGQEHLFRTLGHMYESSLEFENIGEFTSVRDLPNHFADLLINGHAIEMLNGDSGIIQLIWIKAICDSVLKKLPNLKVFVISIIGLQSSGKSTLLNALFSCRFAVSVGRCSRGLFMRMIFLDDTLKCTHGFDAIILIDTEGLSSPEKMNDPKAHQKDRLMATFAMGISNLTIVNILGEGMTEITEILQIAIVAMARLRVGSVKPDILMVQHLQERNKSKVDLAKDQFCEAINKTFELISKNDVAIGATYAECLNELTARIQSDDLFQYFGSFRDGSRVNSPPAESYHSDVVRLLEAILKRAEVFENKTTFDLWCSHFESYWACVQEETFALNFKNVKHITDFLYFEKKIAKVKELLDRAIRSHREIFSKNITEEVSSQIAEGRQTDSMQNRKGLLAVIEQQLGLIPKYCPRHCQDCREFNDSHATLSGELNHSESKEDTLRSLEWYKSRLLKITMNMLSQTFDGSLVRQGCFSDFSDRIESDLKEALLKRPSGIYSSEEQDKIVKTIWNNLLSIASKMESGPDLETKLNETMQREYSGVYPTVLKDLENEITFDQLANSKGIKSRGNMVPQHNTNVVKHLNEKLSEDELKNLISTINDLTESVLERRCVNFRKTGLDFEEGMVCDIKTEFPDTIKKFEERFRLNLQDAFKISLQMYALQQFGKHIRYLQNLWDSHNKPSEILKQKEHDYLTEIETRLKSGFSSKGEGEVLAAKLCNAVKIKAIQAGYDEKIKLIKDLSWTTNSEKVRLHYFEELALEVDGGEKKRALLHFQNPKDSIQKWYKDKITSFEANEEVSKVYKTTLKTELNLLALDTSECTKESEIVEIFQEYIKAVDDQYYSKLDTTDDNFSEFREIIQSKLMSFGEIDDRENIVFPLASDDSEIMDRLGCTEQCYWCGALCWGSSNHQLEKDKFPEMEKHHSCHQPMALKGAREAFKEKLHSRSCHIFPENSKVLFGKYEDKDTILWSEAKENHFQDWNFDVHCIPKFDELMRWFFQELNHDIAKSIGVLPADEKNLEETKCTNLKLDEILRVVRSKIR